MLLHAAMSTQKANRQSRRGGRQRKTANSADDKAAADEKFLRFLPAIKRGARDERNFVKKAVNWALRQIGKRNRNLNRAAILAARMRRLRDEHMRAQGWLGFGSHQGIKVEASRS